MLTISLANDFEERNPLYDGLPYTETNGGGYISASLPVESWSGIILDNLDKILQGGGDTDIDLVGSPRVPPWVFCLITAHLVGKGYSVYVHGAPVHPKGFNRMTKTIMNKSKGTDRKEPVNQPVKYPIKRERTSRKTRTTKFPAR